MKAYSRSQGKVVETAGQPAAGLGGSGGGFGGMDDETVRQAFFLMGAKNPKQISKLSSLYEFIKPQAEKPEAVARTKLTGLGQSGLQAAQNVRQFYSEDPKVLTKQLIPGKFKSRKFDAALFQAVDSLLRIRSGAAVPEKEVRRYMKGFGPRFGDDPSVVEFKLKQLEDSLAKESGVTPLEGGVTPPTQPPSAQAPVQTQGQVPPGASLLPWLTSAATGLIPGAGQIPGVRGALAGAGFATGERAQQVLKGQAPPEAYQWGPAGRGLTGKEAGRVATGALADLLLTGAGKLIKGGGLKGLTGTAREKAAAKVTKPVPTKSIKASAEAYIKDDPLAKTYGEKILPGLGKKLSQSELVRKLKVWNKAYTQAGKVGKSSKAGFYNALARSGGKLLDTGVAKYNKLFKMLYGVEKVGKRMMWPAITGLGGAAGYGLSQALGGG